MSNNNEYNNGCKIQRFRKNNYFYGKFMSVEDFQEEQQYMDGKRRLLNRLIFRSGIVCGFSQIEKASPGNPGKKDNENEITFIDGGVAIDNCGNEIVVPAGSTKTFSKEEITGNTFYLYLKYKQLPADPVEALTDSSGCEKICHENRIVEDFEVIASTDAPDPVKNKIFSCDELHDAEDKDKFIKECLGKQCSAPDPGDPKVFLAAISGNLTIDPKETLKYRSYVHNNQLLRELITCHIADPIHFEKGEFYEAKEISLKSKTKWEYDHNFGRFPVVDAYEKVISKPQKKKKFTFFFKDEFKEIAKILGETENKIGKEADIMENFGKGDDDIPVFHSNRSFNQYFEELKKDFEVYATKKVMEKDYPSGLARRNVYFIEQPSVAEFYWRKITGCTPAPDLEIQVDENRIVVKSLEKTGEGTFKLILQA
jgi:hypothetical protein